MRVSGEIGARNTESRAKRARQDSNLRPRDRNRPGYFCNSRNYSGLRFWKKLLGHFQGEFVVHFWDAASPFILKLKRLFSGHFLAWCKPRLPLFPVCLYPGFQISRPESIVTSHLHKAYSFPATKSSERFGAKREESGGFVRR